MTVENENVWRTCPSGLQLLAVRAR